MSPRSVPGLGWASSQTFRWSSGLLTGKYRRGEEPPAGTKYRQLQGRRAAERMTDANFDVVEALQRFGRAIAASR